MDYNTHIKLVLHGPYVGLKVNLFCGFSPRYSHIFISFGTKTEGPWWWFLKWSTTDIILWIYVYVRVRFVNKNTFHINIHIFVYARVNPCITEYECEFYVYVCVRLCVSETVYNGVNY